MRSTRKNGFQQQNRKAKVLNISEKKEKALNLTFFHSLLIFVLIFFITDINQGLLGLNDIDPKDILNKSSIW